TTFDNTSNEPPGPLLLLALRERLLQGVERKVGSERARDAPAHDPPTVGVDHKRHVDKAPPRGNIGQVRDPELVGTPGPEVPLHPIERPLGSRLCKRRPHLPAAANRPSEAKLSHKALDRAARHPPPLSPEWPPNLARTVDLEVLRPDAPNLPPQHLVTPGTKRSKRRIALSGLVRIVGRWSDRKNLADRLDSIRLPVRINEGHHHLSPRSSSAWAEKAAAFRRISFARLSSRFSRSSPLIRSSSAVLAPGRLPSSRSACLTQRRSVSLEQPIFSAIDSIAAHCDGYSPSGSSTSRTARSRISREYLFASFMTPIPRKLRPPANPGRFTAKAAPCSCTCSCTTRRGGPTTKVAYSLSAFTASSLRAKRSNQLRRYNCVLMKFDGRDVVPCHSSRNRIIAVGTCRIFSAM